MGRLKGMSNLSKVATTSESIEHENLQKLRAVFPEFVKENTIDFDALKAFFEKEGMLNTEKYGLSWAGKSRAFQAIRTPATGTLVPQREESKNWDETENLFIEGDNLEVLKLLQKHYREKIKMIYIDPPYNTGKDFVYKDNFTQGVADYYEQTGQTKNGIKMTANTEKNGRYHSDWLTMMYPRLFLARNLLKDDGVIFVSIDDNEVANLRLIMDEIFGEDNFVQNFMWLHGKGKKDKNSRTLQQYIVCYAKSKTSINEWSILRGKNYKFENPDNDPDGPWFSGSVSFSEERSNKNHENFFQIVSPSGIVWERQWQYSKEDMMNFIENNKIYWGTAPEYDNVPRLKIRPSDAEEVIPENIIDNVGTTKSADSDLENLMGSKVFSYPKPIKLISHLAALATDPVDIVIDFFAGSGTTAHAVMDLNAEDDGKRKWICVQLPEILDAESAKNSEEKRTTKNAIEFCVKLNKPTNIAEISRERIRRAGDKTGKGDIGFKSFKLSNSNYRKWNELGGDDDTETILKESKLFIEKPLVDSYDEKSVVYEILEKEGFGLNAKVEQEKGDLKPWVVTEDERKLIVTFANKVSKENAEALKLSDNDIFVCFDNALDDTTKVNIGRSINIKTI